LKEKDFILVSNFIKEYYSTHKNSILIPQPIKEREYGFAIGPNRLMTRHKGFQDESGIRYFLSTEAPLDAYHSVAFFRDPTANMDEKGLKGADLFFDIDADHIDPNLGRESTVWICESCNTAGTDPQQLCPTCKRRVKQITFPNVSSIEASRNETTKLMRILRDEFGLPEDKTNVHFSGNRGFHVYVCSDNVKNLGQDARKEILDYIIQPPSQMNIILVRGGSDIFLTRLGLPGRILGEIKEMLRDQQFLSGLFGTRLARKIDRRLQEIFSELDVGKLNALIKVMTISRFEILFKQALIRNMVKVDPVVTTDLHRLVRMPGSINSKTGLPKKEVDLKRESAKSILSNMCLHEDLVKVLIRIAPKIEIGNSSFGPYENVITDLPSGIAVLLVLKGVAEVVGA
jgi:DNA primase small subunit